MSSSFRKLVVPTAVAGCSILGLVGCAGTSAQSLSPSSSQTTPAAPTTPAAATTPAAPTTPAAAVDPVDQARAMLQTYYAAVHRSHYASDPALRAVYFTASAVAEDKTNGAKGDNQPGDHSVGAYCSPQQVPGTITVGAATRQGDLATFSVVTGSASGNAPVDGTVTVDLRAQRITGWTCPPDSPAAHRAGR